MINITYILNMTSEEQFFLGMIVFGYVVLILGFVYCVSRYLMIMITFLVKVSSSAPAPAPGPVWSVSKLKKTPFNSMSPI